ncbi:mechanosensitive ion channel family protein [Acidiferrimicrobium sp. IK]|uniref:mechanosensitive ion channel family protein n=1 Tax=Acidiferrimicrobium sp. IK TaxID=2871700 RepID=UPI0021CB65A2|nr:mechanosensitive ion channel family protein [Acidiferrimicrobium sp. IK]MCU4186124.1 mechanosensitive ion channel family protein [Acidiferrimicrobium sp. IK]
MIDASAPHHVHSALSTLLGVASGSATNDRGVIYQFLTSVGVGSSTAHDVQVYAVGPLRIVLVFVIAFVITRLVSRLSRRLVGSLRLVSPLVKATPRGADRARTLAGVITSILKAIIWIVAFLTALGELSINLAPFVATATVIGAAVGFGAQTLVKDFLSGVLILAEDQYGVGDSITINSSGTTGVVESVNLRTTRVRALDGMVWYVPNGDIRAVGNSTETDSAALVDIMVPHGTDLVAAGHEAEAAARRLAARPEWESVFSAPPAFVGVQATDNDSVTLRVIAHTTPGSHYRAARELRLAILEALRVEGLAWAEDPPALSPAPPAASPAGVAAAAPAASADAGVTTASGAAGSGTAPGGPTERSSATPPRRFRRRG